MDCGYCGEELDPVQECNCPGSSLCTCEFVHHHFGCCESYEDIVTHFMADNPQFADDDWAIVGRVPLAVLDAHDEYMMRGKSSTSANS